MNQFNINDYMSKFPYLGRKDMTVQAAYGLLKNCDIRHLPIVDDGKVVGIVSDRDLKEVQHLVNPQPTLGEVMNKAPFTVKKGSQLHLAVQQMAKGKYGSVLIEDETTNEIIGIFTTTDALKLLANLIRETPEPHLRLVGDGKVEFFEEWKTASI